MNLVKILIATFAVSTAVSFTVALIRAKRKIDKVAKEAEEELLKTAEELKTGAQRAELQAHIGSDLLKDSLKRMDESEQHMQTSMDILEESIMDQPAIKVGGKNKVDPLEFARTLKPEDILPV